MNDDDGRRILDALDRLAATVSARFERLEAKVDAGFRAVNDRLDRIERIPIAAPGA